jgi:hypothetical protein
MSEYAPEEPASFDAIIEQRPYERAVESADPFVGKEGLAEAADEVSRGRETKELTVRQVHDPDDLTKVAEKDVTWSKEAAADALRETRNYEAQLEQADRDAQLAAGVDEFRGQQPAQPQPPEFQQAQPQPQAPEVQAEYVAEPDALDRLLNSVPDENVRRHIKQGLIDAYSAKEAQIEQARQAAVAHAEQARAAFEQQTVSAILTAEAAALAPFPELHGIPRDQIAAVLAHIGRTNPQRHAEIRHHVANVKELAANQLQAAQLLHQQQIASQAQQQAASQAQQAYAAQQFREYAELHDSRTLVNETPETRKAIESALIEDAGREGIDKEQLVQIWNSNPVARHSFFQNLVADGLKYRLAQRNIPRAVARPIPKLQRPGVASEEARDHGEYASLERQYRGQSLTPKQAAELVIARRGRR